MTDAASPMPESADFAAYLRALPGLLKAGNAGRVALIHGGEVVSIWDTPRDAIQAGHDRFGLDAEFLTQPVRLANLDAGLSGDEVGGCGVENSPLYDEHSALQKLRQSIAEAEEAGLRVKRLRAFRATIPVPRKPVKKSAKQPQPGQSQGPPTTSNSYTLPPTTEDVMPTRRRA